MTGESLEASRRNEMHQTSANDQNVNVCDSRISRFMCTGHISLAAGMQHLGVLVCETWPSWLFVFEALAVHCSVMFIMDECTKKRNILESMYPTVDIRSMSLFCKWCDDNYHSDTVLFAQGGAGWFKTNFSLFQGFNKGIVSISHGSIAGEFTGWSYQTVDSSAAGSVICGLWGFLTKGFNGSIHLPALYQRQVKHVIDVINRGISIKASSSEGEHGEGPVLFRQHIDWTEQLPKSRPLVRIRCQCVFGKPKWVERQLTSKELAKAFDVPLGLHEKFCHWPLF
jgi:hypothetical protein